jgi:hypothetical protein
MTKSAVIERVPTEGIAAAEVAALDRLAETLAVDFPQLSAGEITATIAAEHGRFAGSAVRDFIPIFVDRSARRHLTDLARRRVRIG